MTRILSPVAGALSLACMITTGFHAHADEFGERRSELRGGEIVEEGSVPDGVLAASAGVVEFGFGGGGICTGAIIAPTIILTAAHCINGNPGPRSGTMNYSVDYHDPERGLRTVYAGPLDFVMHRDYNGLDDVSDARNDVAILIARNRLLNVGTDDYARIFAGDEDGISDPIRFFGTGFLTFSGATDRTLRTAEFDVETIDDELIRIDNRTETSVCRGDSGGPGISSVFSGGEPIPAVSGVLSLALFDLRPLRGEGPNCANNDPGPRGLWDNAWLARTTPADLEEMFRFARLEPCERETHASSDYVRCFPVPLVNDTPGEGLDEPIGVAITNLLL
ncbi:MAG: trypsin-like serine protease [Pseudomonadota bacterium]